MPIPIAKLKSYASRYKELLTGSRFKTLRNHAHTAFMDLKLKQNQYDNFSATEDEVINHLNNYNRSLTTASEEAKNVLLSRLVTGQMAIGGAMLGTAGYLQHKKKASLKHYTYGYRKIHPLAKINEEWDYSVQLHKNQNGSHFDFRVLRPGDDKAVSWAMKKYTAVGVKPVLAMRTHDHNIEHMKFEGPLATAKGFGNVKLVDSGKIKVKSIDEAGIKFEMKGKDYRLRPFKGRRYLFEQVLY